MDDDIEHKKARETKKCVIKRGIMFKKYKDCNFNNKDLKLTIIMYILNKSIRLHQVVMMIRDCKPLRKLQRIHTEQTHSTHAKKQDAK